MTELALDGAVVELRPGLDVAMLEPVAEVQEPDVPVGLVVVVDELDEKNHVSRIESRYLQTVKFSMLILNTFQCTY